MTGPNTRTTQIYICKTDMSAQDKDGFAPLGTVLEGMDVVDRLYAGYGETSGGGMRGGKQGRIFEEGNSHLDRDFPKLEKLVRAQLVR
jgi:homoserine O-acetyltransferase